MRPLPNESGMGCLFVLLVMLISVAHGLEVEWIPGDTGCPEEWSISPPSPTDRTVVHFSGPTGVHANGCEGLRAGGGTPTIVVDKAHHAVELWFAPPAPGFCPAVYAPVCGLQGEFGPLEAGNWTFYSTSPITNFSLPFDVSETTPTLQVTCVRPLPGLLLHGTPEAIVVTFGSDVCTTSVNRETFKLRRSSGDGIFNDGHDIEITAASIEYLRLTRQARFNLGSQSLPNDLYQITLTADLDAMISSEATVLALEISGELLPPPALYQQLYDDLTAIRKTFPFTMSIKYPGKWTPGMLLISLTDEAWEDFLNGDYHGLDALNAQYGPVEIVLVFKHFPVFVIEFSQPYHPELLAAIYAAAEGVHAAQPNYHGYGIYPLYDAIEVSIPTYTFRKCYEWDCHYWVFAVDNGNVTLIDDYGDTVGEHMLSWCIHDTKGEVLDGEFSGTFPSGDGTPGGDFVATFRIGPATHASYWMIY